MIPSVSDPLGVPFQGPTVPYGVGFSSPPFFLNQLPLHCTFCFPPSPLSLRATAELSRVFRLVPRGPVCGLRLDSVGVGDLERTGPKRFRLLRVRSARILVIYAPAGDGHLHGDRLFAGSTSSKFGGVNGYASLHAGVVWFVASSSMLNKRRGKDQVCVPRLRSV